ncbi:hypothetical protein AbraIFM66951_005091 [Aspergillus brasiliensis]|uniref:Cytochrome b5 heme-binding domain-containing protein n=1 Tax=Aspergillus brasiliensis TaxID=319629 RepID=A0A9W6DRX2_9EURO|nr:hypothetical protein AbraCBS73388_004456 [Aspergillus brasiliensis]GKZ51155.1 hypothetical protein AbraIFM66951_005091 [Aspergillus brasiliensis]
MRSFTSTEVKELGPQQSLVIIHGKVYNVSGYLDEHPGGRDLLLDVIGTDATDHFVQAGHSDEAREILAGLAVGKVKDYQRKNAQEAKSALFQTEKGPAAPSSLTTPRLAMAVPGAVFFALLVRLVVRHVDIGITWIRLPSNDVSLTALPTPSALLVFVMLFLMAVLGGLSYWVSTIFYVEFGYGKYPEVIPSNRNF